MLRSADELTAVLHAGFPPGEGHGDIRVEQVDASSIRLRMGVADRHLRPGATVSGPALFGLADSVAWLMTLAHLDEGRDAVTAGVSMQFLRRPERGDLVGTGRLLRMGRRLSVTDVLIHSDGVDQPVAQATVTYAPV